MKFQFILSICLFTTSLFAQEVTTKKGKILFDDKEIASINKEKKLLTVTSNDGTSKYSFLKSDVYLVNKAYTVIYTVTDLNTNKVNNLFIYEPFAGLNGERIFVKNLAFRCDYLNEDGLNIEKINEFLDGDYIDKDEKIKQLNDDIVTRLKNAKQKFKDKGLFVENWSVYRKEDGKNIQVAYIKKKNISTFNFTLELYKTHLSGDSTKIGIWSTTEETNFAGKKEFFFKNLHGINGEKVLINAPMGDNEKNSISSSEVATNLLYYMTEFGYFD